MNRAVRQRGRGAEGRTMEALGIMKDVRKRRTKGAALKARVPPLPRKGRGRR